MKALTLLKSGGEFAPRHVYALQRMLRAFAPGLELACLSDVEIPGIEVIPLREDIPGWWGKMHAHRPDIEGTILWLDLDTVIVDPILDLLEDDSRSIVMRDAYRGREDPGAIQASVMILTEEARAEVWAAWQAVGPAKWMAAVTSDQPILESVLAWDVEFFQDTHPGAVVSYKVDIRDRGLPRPPLGTRIVAFHGQPRPWACGASWAEEAFL